jgi:hypothetical protein
MSKAQWAKMVTGLPAVPHDGGALVQAPVPVPLASVKVMTPGRVEKDCASCSKPLTVCMFAGKVFVPLPETLTTLGGDPVPV